MKNWFSSCLKFSIVCVPQAEPTEMHLICLILHWSGALVAVSAFANLGRAQFNTSLLLFRFVRAALAKALPSKFWQLWYSRVTWTTKWAKAYKRLPMKSHQATIQSPVSFIIEVCSYHNPVIQVIDCLYWAARISPRQRVGKELSEGELTWWAVETSRARHLWRSKVCIRLQPWNLQQYKPKAYPHNASKVFWPFIRRPSKGSASKKNWCSGASAPEARWNWQLHGAWVQKAMFGAESRVPQRWRNLQLGGVSLWRAQLLGSCPQFFFYRVQ